MEQTFEKILSSLLDSYEKSGSKDIEALLSEKSEEFGLTEESMTLIKDASQYIDKFSEKAAALEAAKEEGLTTRRWLTEDLDKSMEALSDEEKAEVMEGLSKQISEIQNKVKPSNNKEI